MTEVIIYTKQVCPYCVRAKNLLKQKGISEWEEIDIGADEKRRNEMIEKSGGRMTVPQIFINGVHVGGFDDMAKMEKEGKLDPLLNKVG